MSKRILAWTERELKIRQSSEGRTICATRCAWDSYIYWQRQDRKTLKRINKLIKAAKSTPFEGIGKPEPLKENLSGARIKNSPVVEQTQSVEVCFANSEGRSPSHDLRDRAASRRIDDTNRLVYAVDDKYLTIISCRFHY